MPATQPTVASVLRVPEADGEFSVKALKIADGPLAGRQLQLVNVRGYAGPRQAERQFNVVFGHLLHKEGSPRAAIIRNSRVVRLEQVVGRWALAAAEPSTATLSWDEASVADSPSTPVAMATAAVATASAEALQEEAPAVAVESEEAFAVAIGIAPIIMTTRVRMTSTSTSLAVQTLAAADRAYYLGPANGQPATVKVLNRPSGSDTIKVPPLYFVEVPANLPPGSALPVPRPIAGDPSAEVFAKFALDVAISSGLNPSEITGTQPTRAPNGDN